MNLIQDETLTKVKPDPKKEEKAKQAEIPIYYEKLKLDDEQKSRIVDEILDEFKELKEERDSKRLEAKWDALENQYNGIVEEDERRMFNLCRQTTRTKVNKVTNLIMQAFLKSDPKYSVSPRPEFQKQGGQEVCDKQSDFLDYKLDNLPFREPEGMTVHSAVLKGTGFTRVQHTIKREKRKREECYKGENKVMGMGPNGQPIIKNEGLEEFLRNWPDAPKDHPQFVKQLMEGKEVRFVAEFTETTYNDPSFTPVNIKDFWARLSCDGYEGLKTTKLTVERIPYLYWDLKKEEKRGFFYDVDDLTYQDKDNKAKKEKFENKSYDILRCVFYAKLKEGDEEEIKGIFYIYEEKKKMIGSILFPYYGIDCDYVPHYIMKKEPGLYGIGLGEILTDSHAAENALLNGVLESTWMQNLITPIVTRNSGVVQQFASKSWTHGVPLVVDDLEKVDFLQKYMSAPEVPGMITLMQFLLQGDDDATGVSSLMSGRESPLDPTAPASKTIALLQQSGINIEDYILTISPAFNTIGEILLQLYYQMAQDGVQYRVSPDRARGKNPFAVLTRADMIAKTSIQVMAYAFDFDRLNSQKLDVGLYQLLRQEPLFNADPQQVYVLLKNIVKGWSPKWNNLVDEILPDPQTLQKQQISNAVNATATYIKAKIQESKVTGLPPEFDIRQLVPVVAQGQKLLATPMSEEEAKLAEQAMENKGGA